jgi:anti-anti-sigma factor
MKLRSRLPAETFLRLTEDGLGFISTRQYAKVRLRSTSLTIKSQEEYPLRPVPETCGGADSIVASEHGREAAEEKSPWLPLFPARRKDHSMTFEISPRQREGVDVFDLRGPLVFGDSDLQFRNATEALIGKGKNRLVLSFADVTAMDTVGLGTLLWARQELRKTGGDLALTKLRPAHLDLLTLAKLEALFQIFTDEQDAIDRFFPDRHARQYDILEVVRSQKPPEQKLWS